MCFVSDNCFHEDRASRVQNVTLLMGRMCQVISYCYIPLLDCLIEKKPECISSLFYVGPNITETSIIFVTVTFVYFSTCLVDALLWPLHFICKRLHCTESLWAFRSFPLFYFCMSDHHKYWWLISCALLSLWWFILHLRLCEHPTSYIYLAL